MTKDLLQLPELVDLSADFDECDTGSTIPVGLKDGKPVDITMVVRGKDCECVCPACGRPLVAAQGEQRQYFRHLQRGDCTTGHETGVHLLAKEILAECKWLRIPAAYAEHGNLPRRIATQEQDWPFQSAEIEKNLTGKDGRRIRPDLIVKGETKGRPFELLIEIRVRHKQELRKEAEIKQRGLAAIEIDLSRQPPIATREYYREQILRQADRHWIFNRHAERVRLEMQKEAELRYDRIVEKIKAASYQPFAPRPDKWVEEVEGARLDNLIGLEIKGGECFAVFGKVWQAAILHRYVLSPHRQVFDPQEALLWLEREGLLKSVFARLVHDRDKDRLAHIRDSLTGFREPYQVVSNYAGEISQSGLFQKRPGGHGWQIDAEIQHAAIGRYKEFIRWRLRMAELQRAFNTIKERARRAAEMRWDEWFETPLLAYQGIVPRDLLSAPEPQFRIVIGHLEQLRAMLGPGATVPNAGLLELPLEPERDQRLEERREVAELAERRAAEQQAKRLAGMRAREEEARKVAERTARTVTPGAPYNNSRRRQVFISLQNRVGEWLLRLKRTAWR